MTNFKTTKRALFTSSLSLLLCVAMLIGSTFAWFTDSATTGVNTIVAGNLDIDIVDSSNNSLQGGSLGFVKNAGGAIITDDILWEPGCRYILQPATLVNKGNLWVKYRVMISAVNGADDGEYDLASVIDVYEGSTHLGTLRQVLAMGDNIKEGVLAPNGEAGDKASFGEIKLVMQESAGNEYMNTSIESIAIKVEATQKDTEEDSYGDDYDAEAPLPLPTIVKSDDEIDEVLANVAKGESATLTLAAGTYVLPSDGTMQNKKITIKGSSKTATTIDFTGYQVGYAKDLVGTELTIENATVKWLDGNHAYQGIKNPQRVVYKNCTIIGTQFMYSGADFIDCTFEVKNDYNVYTRANGDYTFTNCTFNTGGRAVMLYHDYPVTVNVTLTNCKFSDDGTYNSKDKAAVETGDISSSSKFNIVLNGCEIVEGFETNNSTSPLWGNKDSMPKDRLNVVIDGTDVY